jgi:hypothetical protein
VVPYNPSLTLKYDAHINVEVCSSMRACKYFFKYVHKGSDRAATRVETVAARDEIGEYQDCRSIGASEAAWRIFGFDMAKRYPDVHALPSTSSSSKPCNSRRKTQRWSPRNQRLRN